MNQIEKKYKKLTDIEHVLLRPGMYIGSIKPHTDNKWMIEDGMMVQKEMTYNQGFLKIFDEIITNSVDESKRKDSTLDTIKITIDKKSGFITVADNGGIPVVKHSIHKQYIPEMIFSNLKAGSNFDDTDDRYCAGTNGVGSTLTNIYSTVFIVKTADRKNSFEQTFTDNMRKRTTPKIKASKKGYTEISYHADFEKFGLNSIDDVHYKLIEKRVYDIAACNPKMKIYLNGEMIKMKSFEDYIKMYTNSYIYDSKKDGSWSIGISSSHNGFQQVSFCDSIDTFDGGSHVDYLLNQIIIKIREYFLKKHKTDIKPSEIKNHMFVFIDATVLNPSFSSQTKEKLITEQKDFGYDFNLTDKFINSILKSDIIDSILDWIQQKKIADENKLQRELNKKISKIKVEKLIDAKGRNRTKCNLFIFEGDSAASSFRKYRNPQNQGAFLIRGKFINISDISIQKIIANQEAINLMASLGLKIGQKIDVSSMRYRNVYITADADTDGDAISSLLINFFYRYWRDMFDMNMIYRILTPIVVAKSLKKKNDKIYFYNQAEFDEWLKKSNVKEYVIDYKKGLAALSDDEYKEMIQNPKKLLITNDDMALKSLDVWFGKNTEKRKDK